MILDFNSDKLRFVITDISKYNLDTIYNNIDKFRKFVHDSVISDTFEKVYNTYLFQITLLDETMNYLDNLLITYNAIINNMTDENLPEITEKQLKQQLIARGFEIRRTSRRVIYGSYEVAYKVIKEEKLW